MNSKKIEVELIKIGKLKLRIERLINNSQNEILTVKKEFDFKVNKIYTLIELAQEKIRKLKVEDLKDKEIPGELDYDFGIDWIHEEKTDYTPKHFEKIETAEDYLGEDLTVLLDLE